MALKQIQNLKQQLKLSPQQLLLLNLIQLPVTALEQKIQEELENNPALETLNNELNNENNELQQNADDLDSDMNIENNDTDEQNDTSLDEEDIDSLQETRESIDYEEYMDDEELDSYKYENGNQNQSDKNETDFFSNNLAVSSEIERGLSDILLEQLEMQDMSEKEYQIGEYLIGCLDDDGYLRRDLQSISNDLLFLYNLPTTTKEIEKVLHIIQNFDPPGIAARNLQECLLIQIKRKLNHARIHFGEGHPHTKTLQLASTIIEKHFDLYSKKHYDKLLFNLNITEEQLKQASEEITHLNPKPGHLQSSEKVMSIIPDFIVNIVDGKPELSINNALIPELTISKEYIDMLNEYSQQKNTELQKASKFIKSKIDEAKWFIDALQERERILLNTMYQIMEEQKEFFITGDPTKLKPLLEKDLAEKMKTSSSIISRIVNSKYVSTPYGTFPLKFFFGINTQTKNGEETTSKDIKHFIQQAIEYEDKKKPLTDEELCKLLNQKGYTLKRRTVSKYREELGIPVARLRRKI